MHSEYYEYPTFKGPLTLEKDEQNSWSWNLYLNGTLIQKGYTDPYQAAVDANKSEFTDETMNSILKGVFINSDIRQWSTSRQRQLQKNNQNN